MAFKQDTIDGDPTTLTPGERARYNHTGCEAGVDSRQRCYVERPLTDPTKLIYYCHNCGDGGAWRDDGFQQFRDRKHNYRATKLTTSFVIAPPRGLIQKTEDMPSYAQGFVVAKGITDSMMTAYGMGYDPNSDRFYLPQYRSYDEATMGHGLEGYQLRLLHGVGTKYLTTQHPEFQGYTLLEIGSGGYTGWPAVIVEDLLSGIAVTEALGPAVDSAVIAVNYGTKINSHLLWKLQNCSTVHVWLDNDSAFVRRQASHIARTAELYGPRGEVHDGRQDPKYYSSPDILEELGLG